MKKNKELRLVLTFLVTGLIITGGFSCNIVGPHNPTGPDTTTNNFTWTTYRFGGNAGASYFKDVAIINDSDIWAVGQIYTTVDSIYNAAHWNGEDWTLLRVPYYYQGQPLYNAINSVFAFDTNDVWFGIGSMIHWDGENFEPVDNSVVWGPHNIYRIWGTSGSNFYIVGDAGSIAHYSAGTWTKMSSGTTIDLRDIWGSSDGKTIWACGYSNDNSQSILLKYDGTSWKSVWSSNPSSPPYGGLITSLWGSDSLYLIGTDGVFRQSVSGAANVEHLFSLTNFPYSISGSAGNNIVFVGDDAMIYHFNGAGWELLNVTTLDEPLYSVAVSTNTIAAVGADYTVGFGAALIYMGRRQ